MDGGGAKNNVTVYHIFTWLYCVLSIYIVWQFFLINQNTIRFLSCVSDSFWKKNNVLSLRMFLLTAEKFDW